MVRSYIHATATHREVRQGSVYIMVLASSILITVIGLASMFAIRIQRRSAHLTVDADETRLAAQSALELGLLLVATDPNWRTTWTNGIWLDDRQLGNVSFDLSGVDPQDADLSDSDEEPLLLTGIATKGLARHKAQVALVPEIRPLEALNTCLHAAGLVHVRSGGQITAFGGAVSANGQLNNEGTIVGDAEAASVTQAGVINGTLTSPVDAKLMPGAQVIADYIAKATPIPDAGTIEKVVLTPTYNPWGAPNADGLYYVDASGDITIRKLRVHGTLIVRTQIGKKAKFEDRLFLENYRADYPTLIVDGEAEIKHKNVDGPLSEASAAANFNPTGAPYEGQSDTDQLDDYPNEIRGLVHISGFLKLQETARFRGAIICASDVEVDGMNTITHDSRLYTSPPQGYRSVEIRVSAGSYKQVVD